MTDREVLLDTDILSAVMRRRQLALAHAQTYLTTHDQFTFSILTRYEILRGLTARGATAQLAAFERLCAASRVIALTDAIVARAADVYAELHRGGRLIGDADILIAASALVHNLVVVTNNQDHFRRVPGLQLENWLV